MTTLASLMDDTDDGDVAPSFESLHIFNIEHTTYNGKLKTHLFGRLQDGSPRHIQVVGHKPSFLISEDDFSRRIKNHHLVTRVERGYESINGTPLIRLYTDVPTHVTGDDETKGLREYFETTWEADVRYETRFLIDTGIQTHVRYNTADGYTNPQMGADYQFDVSDIQPVTDPNWKATPRVLTADIEVQSPDGFPEAADADYPVTAIAAHDNHTEQLTVFLLCDEQYHDVTDSDVESLVVQNRPNRITLDEETVTNTIESVNVYRDESLLLAGFNEYVANRRFDILTGWNSSATDNGDAFDYPYLINRCQTLNTYTYDTWSPLQQIWTTRRGREQNLTVGGKGVTFLDGMTTYQKTLWSEPDGGMGLANISSIELPSEATKLSLEDEVPDGIAETPIDWAWKHDLGLFSKYVIRDTQATVGVDRSADALALYQNLRRLTGATFGECDNNIDLLDHYILRFAYNEGISLPTNTVPERNWFYGGYVFEPEYGRHENTLYPDVWSEYPNAFRTCNLSPETIIGTKDDLDASQYTEADCRWSYIDTRRDEVKQASDPDPEKCYYLKPSVKVGFMNKVVDHVMGLKDEYDGTELYGPVKQVVNSVWGVYGDADSYGKGYRLFDWRVAESITLYGRTVITNTAEKFIEEVNSIKSERNCTGQNAYVVGGDTDSVMTALPFCDATSLDDQQQAVDIAQEACYRVNEWYSDLAADKFNCEPEAAAEYGRTLHDSQVAHYIELEIESYGPTLYIPEPKSANAAGKKRYAQVISWDEGEWLIDEPVVDGYLQGSLSYTGIDVVRSDKAAVTKDIMKRVLEPILRSPTETDARETVYNEIDTTVTAIQNGETPLSYIARPKGMSKPPVEYGSPSNTPLPTYRGAKYANQHFEWENMEAGSKPQLLYISNVRGDWPRTYTADTREGGRQVDAVAVTDVTKLPDDFVVDTEKMIEKTITDALQPILSPFGWSVAEAVAETTQGSLQQYM